jgi:2,4-dienoyl-CoA reductase-like NADH-dependent reductase (Old Yellow Enzyme family)
MSRLFPHLFSEITIRNRRIRNRILSTGHHTLLARDGKANDALVAYHRARAAGGTGLIILECTTVHESAFFHGTVINGFTDDCIPGFRRIGEAVHAEGATVFGQLFHPGCEVFGIRDDGTRAVAYAPSAVKHERYLVTTRPMSLDLVADVVAGYAATARRMMEAGLDGVEVVASHGYLPSQFLNPRINRRTDRYGGPFENRMRFLTEIAAAVRQAIGPDPVIGLRISGHEEDSRGLQPAECLEAIEALERLGAFDYYNVTAGTSGSAKGAIHIVPPMSFRPGYVAPYARAVKARVSVPVFVTGRINQPHEAEAIIRAGDADICGMTRAQISDPAMARKAAADRPDDIRACVACNQACIGHLYLGAPVSCVQYPETGRELEFRPRPRTERPRRVAVVGGGPAGMKAAIAAAGRGHEVTLYERERRLGGQILLAQLLPGRAEIGGIATNLARELDAAGVHTRLGVAVDRALLAGNRPDHVIVATGARPHVPALELADRRRVHTAWDVLEGRVECGTSVVIADWRGDWISLGIAEKLIREGRQVTLCTSGHAPGISLMAYIRDHWVSTLARLGVAFVPYARLHGADARDVYFEHTCTGAAIIRENVDTIVLSYGNTPDEEAEAAFTMDGATVEVIGDALCPRTVEEAVLEGLRAGWGIA